MNRERVAAELPAPMVAWMDAHADADLWEVVGRTAALNAGRRLLASGGEAGWNDEAHGLLLRDPSPAVRHVAAELGTHPRGRAWSARTVIRLLDPWFDLLGAKKAVYDRLRAIFPRWANGPRPARGRGTLRGSPLGAR